jgi:hypothetical protein
MGVGRTIRRRGWRMCFESLLSEERENGEEYGARKAMAITYRCVTERARRRAKGGLKLIGGKAFIQPFD